MQPLLAESVANRIDILLISVSHTHFIVFSQNIIASVPILLPTNYCNWTVLWEWYFFSQWHRHTRKKKFRVLPTGVEPTTFPITSSDALPLSYRRLVGDKAFKLGSCDKHAVRRMFVVTTMETLLQMHPRSVHVSRKHRYSVISALLLNSLRGNMMSDFTLDCPLQVLFGCFSNSCQQKPGKCIIGLYRWKTCPNFNTLWHQRWLEQREP